MPRAKRPLSEVDPNASNASRKSAKTEATKPTTQKQKQTQTQENGSTEAKEKDSRPADRVVQSSQQLAILLRNSSRKWSMPGTLFKTTAPDHHEQLEAEEELQKEHFDYTNKDNSKLRRFLSERCLPTHGTREELIARLENSSINYEDLSSAQISEMLKERQIRMSSQGTKEYKIERLRINDTVDRDTGNLKETSLYAQLSVMEWSLERALARTVSEYSTLKPKQLSALLERRKLPQSGNPPTLIKRLENDDRKAIEKEIKRVKKEHDSIKHELEFKTGRAVNGQDAAEREDDMSKRALHLEIQHASERPSPTPVCNYDWKDSHWTERTERQLREICSRRGMPGCGPKAAMLKWLDTGDVDYEDMYIHGLTSICMDRGLEYKNKDKKIDLIRRLREADEAE
jgi:hypothetical protein